MTDTTTGPNFTYPPQQPQGWMPPPPPKKGPGAAKVLLLTFLGLLVFGGIINAMGEDDSPDTVSASTETQQTPAEKAAEEKRVAENEAAAAKAEAERVERERAAAELAARLKAEAEKPPAPTDFAISIVVLEKSCFGSAGCNVSYRIDPSYSGTRDASNLEVTYEVRGGEDPSINTFTIDDEGTAHFDSSEYASTASSGAELTAKVTAVRKAP